MSDWAAAAVAALAEGPTALVTVLATEGSAPRGPGARMVVTVGGTTGTIGGGALEYRAIEQARAILAQPAGTWRVQDWPLGPLLGQCCGGRVRLLVERLAEAEWCAAVASGAAIVADLDQDTILRHPSASWHGSDDGDAPAARDTSLRGDDGLGARGPLPAPGARFLEPLDAPARPLVLFGAGHVGRAIARLAADLPFHLAWFDARPDHDAPGVMVQDEAALADCARGAAAEAAVLILTHDHDLDYRLAAASLASPAAFVGLIGSATKRARFTARLARDGIAADRLTCPIGLPGIAGKEPAVIAVAAVAQLLALGPAT